ncbi:MAG: gliding motility protein GldL [Bacteroidales bacterium]
MEGVGGAGEGGVVDAGGGVGGGGTIHLGGGLGGVNVSEEDSESLSSSIKKLNEAAEQISKMADFTEATQKYMEQISAMSEQIEKFSTVTHSLTDVSDGINRNSQNYVQQMELLNRNITGLNTIYEVQLKSISSQISSIEHINAGLNRIKDLYDGSIVDSSVFRSETERMAQQLTQLNTVYARLLQAMTVNMGMPVPNPYQVPFTPAPAPAPAPVPAEQPGT